MRYLREHFKTRSIINNYANGRKSSRQLRCQGLPLRGPKLHIRSMAATAKKGELRSAKRRKQPATKLGYTGKLGKRGAAKHVQLKAADFDRTVIYRGIKIEPTMAVGKRSPLARAVRDDLLRRTKSEQSRGKSG